MNSDCHYVVMISVAKRSDSHYILPQISLPCSDSHYSFFYSDACMQAVNLFTFIHSKNMLLLWDSQLLVATNMHDITIKCACSYLSKQKNCMHLVSSSTIGI